MRIAPLRALVLAIAAAVAAPAAAAADAFWHGHAVAQPQLVLKQGRKWPTDVPLRQGMQNIRAALAAGMGYEALAASVTAEVAGIVQNCRLDPEADAQLHILLVDMLAGVEAMEGKVQGASPQAGVERVAAALEAYAGHFQHPDWNRP